MSSNETRSMCLDIVSSAGSSAWATNARTSSDRRFGNCVSVLHPRSPIGSAGKSGREVPKRSWISESNERVTGAGSEPFSLHRLFLSESSGVQWKEGNFSAKVKDHMTKFPFLEDSSGGLHWTQRTSSGPSEIYQYKFIYTQKYME